METPNSDHYLEANMEAQDQERERRRVNCEATFEEYPADMLLAWLEGERVKFSDAVLPTTPQARRALDRWTKINDMILVALPVEWRSELIDDLQEYEWGDD